MSFSKTPLGRRRMLRGLNAVEFAKKLRKLGLTKMTVKRLYNIECGISTITEPERLIICREHKISPAEEKKIFDD